MWASFCDAYNKVADVVLAPVDALDQSIAAYNKRQEEAEKERIRWEAQQKREELKQRVKAAALMGACAGALIGYLPITAYEVAKVKFRLSEDKLRSYDYDLKSTCLNMLIASVALSCICAFAVWVKAHREKKAN